MVGVTHLSSVRSVYVCVCISVRQTVGRIIEREREREREVERDRERGLKARVYVMVCNFLRK